MLVPGSIAWNSSKFPSSSGSWVNFLSSIFLRKGEAYLSLNSYLSMRMGFY
jgi:hypothetical protein